MPSLLREFLTNMEGDDQFVLPHQHEAASFLVSGFLERAHRGRILNDSVGMGKTRSTLLAVAFLMVHWERLPEELRGGNSVPHVMVVARRDLLNQWQDEWNAILARVRDALGHPTQEEHRLTILKSNENKRQIIAPLCYPAGHIVLQGTTYQSLGHRLSPYMDRRYPWTLVLADEAHAIKNPRTAMFKTMESAVTDYRVLLTGTVVSNDLRDLWAPLNLVHHPDTFPWKSWGIFKRAIVKPLQDRIVNCGRRHKKQLGAHEDLQCAMRQVTLRQESEAVGSSFDLHSTRVIMALPLTTQQSEQMVRAIQPYRGSREHSLEQDKRGILHLTTRLRIISQCSALGSADSVDAFRAEDLSTSTAEGLQEASNKTSFAVRFLRSLLEDPVHPRKHHRVVVVSPYTSYLETLAKCLRTLQGVRLHMAHGGMSVADRTEQLEPFVKRAGGAQRPSRGGKDWEVDREGSEGSSSRGNRSSSLSVLLLSTHVGSEGLNLSRCDILLNMSPTWKVSDLRQVEGRLLRRGQENADVLVVHLICAENSLEETIMCRHSFKQAQDTMVSSMTRRGSSSSSNQRTSLCVFSFTFFNQIFV